MFSMGRGGAFLVLPYRAQGESDTGDVKIILDDAGIGGPVKGDYIRVIFKDGPYGGYDEGGLIGGGQIKVETVE